jgi:hypothetical protein
MAGPRSWGEEEIEEVGGRKVDDVGNDAIK